MDFLSLKAVGFIQLSVLLLTIFNVPAYETVSAQLSTPPPAEAPQHHKGEYRRQHHKHRPTPPPAHPVNAQPPTLPPAEAPQHHKGEYRRHHHPKPRPTPPQASTPLPPGKLLAVQGVVYCKDCKHAGVDTLSGATPLVDAVVRLQCKNTKYTLVTQTKTDKNGYFFIKTITTHESHECKVFLVSSPLATCNKPTNLHHGVEGAILLHATSVWPPRPYVLFTVGPFAFEPSSKVPCRR